jgi:hypothetical protein
MCTKKFILKKNKCSKHIITGRLGQKIKKILFIIGLLGMPQKNIYVTNNQTKKTLKQLLLLVIFLWSFWWVLLFLGYFPWGSRWLV